MCSASHGRILFWLCLSSALRHDPGGRRSLLPVGRKRELAGMPGREDGQRLWLTPTHPRVGCLLIGLGPFGRVGCGSAEGKWKGRRDSSWLAGKPGLFTWQPSSCKEVRAIASRLRRRTTGAGMCSGWKCVSAWSQLCSKGRLGDVLLLNVIQGHRFCVRPSG